MSIVTVNACITPGADIIEYGVECTIVTGPKNSGKTSWCMARYPDAGGVLSLKSFLGDHHVGYDAFNPLSCDRAPLLRRREETRPCVYRSIGAFCVLRDGLEKALSWIDSAGARQTIVIDEVGRLELAGGGFAASVTSILNSEYPGRLVLVVRDSLLDDVRAEFSIVDPQIVHVGGVVEKP